MTSYNGIFIEPIIYSNKGVVLIVSYRESKYRIQILFKADTRHLRLKITNEITEEEWNIQ